MKTFFPITITNIDKILNFLNLRPAEMEFPGYLKKLNPDSLPLLIDNFDEVVSVLKGTPHEKFLD